MPMHPTTPDQSWDSRFFFDAKYAIRRAASRSKSRRVAQLCDHEGANYLDAVAQAEAETPHYWHINLQGRFELHPAVGVAVLAWRPKNWHQLLLEWPHVAESDPNRLAYTKDDRAGVADRQTITTVGKYLRRHWPGLPDHIIRDLDARYNPRMGFKYETGIPALIAAVEFGPRSCMQGAYGTIPWRALDATRLKAWLNPIGPDNPEPDWRRHPYSVYDPRLGWGMATRTASDGEVMGRCLTWTDPEDETVKVFVRSYARNAKGDSSCSGSDAGLESWLQSQGFEKRSAWPDGAKLLAIEHPTKSGYLVPYIDGASVDDRKVSYYGAYPLVNRAEVLEVDCDGDMTCDNTDGTATSDEDDGDYRRCDDCGEREYYGDMTYVGYHGDTCVCSSCADDYVEVRSERGGRTVYYMLARSEAAEVYRTYRQQDGCSPAYWTDPDHPLDDLVAVDGGYAPIDDVVRCTDEEYRFIDDPDVVELAEDCPDSGERYAHQADAWQTRDGRWFSNETDWHWYDGDKWPEDDCWECEGTGLWYPTDEVESVERNGMTVHPDYFDRCSRSAEWGDDVMAEAQEEIREEACEPEPPTPDPVRGLLAALIQQRVSEDQCELALA